MNTAFDAIHRRRYNDVTCLGTASNDWKLGGLLV